MANPHRRSMRPPRRATAVARAIPFPVAGATATSIRWVLAVTAVIASALIASLAASEGDRQLDAIVVEAEGYRVGGEGVSFHDADPGNNGGQHREGGVDLERTTDDGGGFNIGWVEPGEWVTYDVNIPRAGSYRVLLRAARHTSAASLVEVSIGDRGVQGGVEGTGGYQTWQDVDLGTVVLPVGRQVVKILFTDGDVNLNRISFIPNET